MIDWQTIIRKYGPAVWRTAYRLLGNHTDTAECFRETFSCALELSQRQHVRSFAALLVRLATSKAVEQLRRRFSPSQLNVDTIDVVVLPGDGQADTQQKQAHQLAADLRKALVQLPPREAEVLCLRHFNNMSFRQISKELNIKANTAAVLLNRAKAKLRETLNLLPATKQWSGIIKKKTDALNEFIGALKNEPVPTGQLQEITDTALQMLTETETTEDTISITERIKAAGTLTRIAAAAAAIIIILIGGRVFTGLKPKTETVVTPLPAEPETKVVSKTKTEPLPDTDAQLEEEFEKIIEAFTAGDIDALLSILLTGQLQTKMAAAHFLAEIGDMRSLTVLEKLSKDYAAGDPNNPFAAAAAKIKKRLQKARRLVLYLVDRDSGDAISSHQFDVTLKDSNSTVIFSDKTDDQGKAVLNLVPDDYLFKSNTWLNGGFKTHSQDFAVTADDSSSNLTIALMPRPTIYGWLTDAEGQPAHGQLSFAGQQINTDEQGEFKLPEPQGKPDQIYICYALDTEKKSGRAFYFKSSDDPNGLEIVLEPLANITGRIVDANGQGLADAKPQIGFVLPDGQWQKPEQKWWDTTVEADGTFWIEAIPAGLSVAISLTDQPDDTAIKLGPLKPGELIDVNDIGTLSMPPEPNDSEAEPDETLSERVIDESEDAGG